MKTYCAHGKLLCVFLAACGCGRDSPPQEVAVAAAADLRFAFDEVAARFEEKHPGIKISTTYDSSGNLFAQLTQKAPFDLFLSADVDYPRKLIEQVPATDAEFVYALGHLVVWVPASSSIDVGKLGIASLLEPAVKKIAMANPRFARYGRAADSALKKLGVFEKIQAKLVLGDSVSQAAQFVESGAADIGILAGSLVLAPALKDRGRFWNVPEDAHPPLIQAGVVTAWARNRPATLAVRDFLLSDEGRTILRRYGFTFPPHPQRQ